jgi:molecular chaperone GrpE
MNPRAGSSEGTGFPGGFPPGPGASRHASRAPDQPVDRTASHGVDVPGRGAGSGDVNQSDAPDRAPDWVADKTNEPETPGTADTAETDVGAEIEYELGDLIGVLQRERDEYLDTLRRVQADFENYKKRILRQQTDHLERAGEDLVTKMLPVLDAFDLARAHLGEAEELNEEGKALLAASALLNDTLAREGLQRIDDPGAPFDPTTHEAVDHVPDTDLAPAPPDAAHGAAGAPPGEGVPADKGHGGPVVDGVLRAGYRWKGRVIRPALVRVRG